MIINSSETVVKIRRDILLPLYWKYIKRLKVLDYYQELQAHQWNTFKVNRNLQRIKLFKLIQYASQNIPYYQRIIQEAIDYISINLVLIDKIKLKDMDKDFKEISQKFKKLMGEETKVKYNIVDEIKLSPSRKYMYTFSRLENEERT